MAKKSTVSSKDSDSNVNALAPAPIDDSLNCGKAVPCSQRKVLNKELNVSHLICNLIRRNGCTSNPQIAHELNLSIPTAISYSKELLANGLIIGDGKCPSTGGKRATKLVFNPDYAISIGVDIRKSSITIIALDFCLNPVASVDIPLSFEYSSTYFQTLTKHIKDFEKEHLSSYPQDRINNYLGVSVPGIVSPGHMLQSHALKLQKSDLSLIGSLCQKEMLLINDSNAGAMAETANYKENSFFYLSLSKTVGSGIIEKGNLVYGLNERAGEIGHMTLVPHGRICYCGQEGCVDPYLNEASLLDGTPYELSSFFMEYELILNHARLNNEVPKGIVVTNFERYIDYLSVLINNLNNAFDTQIILGGSIGPYLYEYIDRIKDKFLGRTVYPFEDIILPSTIKKTPSAFGAAFIARNRVIDNI